MALEDLKEDTNHIQDQAKSYIDNNLAYFKLRSFKILMKSIIMLLQIGLIFCGLLVFMLFVSIAAAFALSVYFDSYTLGFLTVAFCYLIVTIVVLIFKRKLIERPLLKIFSSIFFND